MILSGLKSSCNSLINPSGVNGPLNHNYFKIQECIFSGRMRTARTVTIGGCLLLENGKCVSWSPGRCSGVWLPGGMVSCSGGYCSTLGGHTMCTYPIMRLMLPVCCLLHQLRHSSTVHLLIWRAKPGHNVMPFVKFLEVSPPPRFLSMWTGHNHTIDICMSAGYVGDERAGVQVSEDGVHWGGARDADGRHRAEDAHPNQGRWTLL